jgi:hypothetical protein
MINKYELLFKLLKPKVGPDCARIIIYDVYNEDCEKLTTSDDFLKRVFKHCFGKILRKINHKTWVRKVYIYLEYRTNPNTFFLSRDAQAFITLEIDKCNYFVEDDSLIAVTRFVHGKKRYFFERYLYDEIYPCHRFKKNFLYFDDSDYYKRE